MNFMTNFVEVIEGGRIVKVSEDYAKREGLLVIRKQNSSEVHDYSSSENHFLRSEKKSKKRDLSAFEKLRKPLGYYNNNVVVDLIDNFHWEIVKSRKGRNMSRKQFAKAIGVNEETVKLIENGILPSDDYIIINKIQSFFGINLRKDGKTFSAPKIESKSKEKPFISKEEEEKGSEISGEDIEIFD